MSCLVKKRTLKLRALILVNPFSKGADNPFKTEKEHLESLTVSFQDWYF